ncbi:hypothetical protein CRG98_031636 [Punica granatum]|uniref:Uncharacterized protein n=1 Tax=Punica granatum TaxID=22663 RepID=A0A2I0IVE4_PUNGR|nr:hypothetical protein CRG98_031636 [Punica granatum]
MGRTNPTHHMRPAKPPRPGKALGLDMCGRSRVGSTQPFWPIIIPAVVTKPGGAAPNLATIQVQTLKRKKPVSPKRAGTISVLRLIHIFMKESITAMNRQRNNAQNVSCCLHDDTVSSSYGVLSTGRWTTSSCLTSASLISEGGKGREKLD